MRRGVGRVKTTLRQNLQRHLALPEEQGSYSTALPGPLPIAFPEPREKSASLTHGAQKAVAGSLNALNTADPTARPFGVYWIAMLPLCSSTLPGFLTWTNGTLPGLPSWEPLHLETLGLAWHGIWGICSKESIDALTCVNHAKGIQCPTTTRMPC
jgi:hypothetical protein